MASPGVLAILASAVSVGSTFDSNASLVVALVLRWTLSVRSASLCTVIMSVVAFECWVRLGVVVAKTTIGTVSVLGALFFNTFSSFALALAIGAFAWKVNFAAKVAKTLVINAYVGITNASCAAVGFGNTFNWIANIFVASLWSSIWMTITVCVASAIDFCALVVCAYLWDRTVGTI